MGMKMSLIKKRRLEKLAKQNAAKQPITQVKESGKAPAKTVSKLRQNMLKGQAKKQPLEFVKDDVIQLENRVDDHDDELQDLKAKLEETDATGNPELETQKAVVAACIESMRDYEDIDDRKPLKAEASVRIEAFVNGYVEGKAKYQNIVAVWYMVWLFDLADIAKAVPLALHLAKQKIQKMPSRFNSEIETFICDQVYSWAAVQLKAKRSAGPYLDDVIKTLESEKWTLPDVVKGKMYAMRGKHFEVTGDDKAALTDYEKAMSINSRAGVKKNIEKLKEKLGN